MFISQQVDSLTEAERYFNPLFLVVAKGKEQLKQQLVRGSICDCDTTLPNRRIGIFSVAPNKQVTFSQGNLQYFPAANIYKFADNQYDILGNANKYFSPAFRNWVDLFEWSSTSTGDFVDWGTNWICGDKPDTWRTLSKDEWDYLLYLRPNADNLRTKATVDGIGGMILLPDNWNTSTNYSLQKVKDNETLLPNVNMFTPAEWVILEEAGVVFLPAAGRSRTYLPDIKNNIFGGYWSSTPKTTNQSYCYSFHVQQMDSYTNFSNCSFGRSVRLVHDTIVPEVIPEPCMVVKVNDTLSINMMCVEGGTFMMGANNDPYAEADEMPAHEVTLSDYYIGQTEVTQALWKAVMGTNPSNVKGDNLPVERVSWNDCQLFIQKLNDLTGLHFRLPTEAEWEYAALGGQKSHGYMYAGSNKVDSVAWHEYNSTNTPKPVATLMPNELGIYDMCGNVYEFCQDWYAPYSSEPQTNPQGPATPSQEIRITRGGSFLRPSGCNRNNYCCITNRGQAWENATYSHCGLRLVLEK